MVTIPTIHLNGSSKKDPLDKLRTAISLIDKAIDGVRQTAPNGRDYYPQGADAFQEAREAFHLRLGKLCEVRGELLEIGRGIIPQGRDAGEGREGFELVKAIPTTDARAAYERVAATLADMHTMALFHAETAPEGDVSFLSARADAFSEAAQAIRDLIPAASILRPMTEAPTDGTPILAKIKDGLTIPIDGVEQPFWWSGQCLVTVPHKRGGETRWKIHALEGWEEFGEHEIEGWTCLPGGGMAATEKGGA